MSTMRKIQVRCTVCGEESEQTVLCSTNRFGAPDLDLRPPEMMRSTMRWWVQECPRCGYVAESLNGRTSVSKNRLKEDAYITCNGIDFRSELARRFYRHYLLCLSKRDKKAAYQAAIRAAWACDDARDLPNAAHCRRLALSLLDQLLEMPRAQEDLCIVKADLLRRVGEFDLLIETFTGQQFSNDLLNRIIAFEIARAKERDSGRYTVDSVDKA